MTGHYRIRIIIDNKVATATIYRTAPGIEFISLLPLTLQLKDFAGTEKIGDLPSRLVTRNALAGHKGATGDITYYSFRGSLGLSYKDSEHVIGLVLLGKVDSGMSFISVAGEIKDVRIELIQ